MRDRPGSFPDSLNEISSSMFVYVYERIMGVQDKFEV